MKDTGCEAWIVFLNGLEYLLYINSIEGSDQNNLKLKSCNSHESNHHDGHETEYFLVFRLTKCNYNKLGPVIKFTSMTGPYPN